MSRNTKYERTQTLSSFFSFTVYNMGYKWRREPFFPITLSSPLLYVYVVITLQFGCERILFSFFLAICPFLSIGESQASLAFLLLSFPCGKRHAGGNVYHL